MSKYDKLGITLNKSGDYSDVRSPLHTGCHLSSVFDNCSRTAPVATPEPSAMTRKGSSSVARVSTGEVVMDFFIFTKASSSLTLHTKVLSFFVRSKRGRAMSEKCSMNRR